MLWALQHPAVRALAPLQQFEHIARVLVVGRLIVLIVVVAPARAGREPLEVVGGEVRAHQLQLFVDMVRVHGMHRRQQGGHLLHALPGLRAALIARIHAIGHRRLSREGNRLVGFPQGQGAKAGVGGQQVEQVGGTGAGQAGDDDGLADFLCKNLGVALPLVLDQQAIAGVANQITQQVGPLATGHVGIVPPFIQQQAQAFAEVLRAEIRQTCALAGSRQHRRLAEFDLLLFPVGHGGALDISQLGVGEVVNANGSRHGLV